MTTRTLRAFADAAACRACGAPLSIHQLVHYEEDVAVTVGRLTVRAELHCPPERPRRR